MRGDGQWPAAAKAIEDGAETRPIEVAISRGEEIGLIGATNMDYDRITAVK